MQLGPFRLEERLGQGGMGVVWAARHVPTDERVAIKTLLPGTPLGRAALSGLEREIRAVAALDHPHIVAVHDRGVVGEEATEGGQLLAGSPWLAMDLVWGGTLAPVVGRVRWPWLRRLLLDVLDALAHAHARGVIHRDIKPANVLVDGDHRRARLTDFGIAHAVEANESAASSARGGTPAYMAPEQILGQVDRQGRRTDLYAVGCLAWALACGEPPFTGEVEAILDGHLHRPPPTLRPHSPMPARFGDWLTCLLRKDPRDRFACAADAAALLRRLELEVGPPLERPPTIAPALPVAGPTAPALPAAGPTAAASPVAGPTAPALPAAGPTAPASPATGPDRAAPTAPSHAPAPGAGAHPAPPLATVPEDWRAEGSPPRSQTPRGVGLELFGLRAVPLVGRILERDRLWSELRDVHECLEPRAIVLRGSAGVGKSRLARWLVERGDETGAGRPIRVSHAPVRGALDGLAPALVRAARESPVDEAALSEAISQAADGEALLEAARPVLEGTLPRPAVLWLDDVQWGDESLSFATAALEGDVPLLIVLTAQDEALAEQPEAAAQLDALAASPRCTTVEVSPLVPRERVELIEGLLGLRGALANAVQDRSGGNPLFAVHLVGDWVRRGLLVPEASGFRLVEGAQADLPRGLADVWTAALGDVLDGREDRVRAALEAAAALGLTVDRGEWGEVCTELDLSPPQALLSELELRRLVRRTDTGFEWAHGMVREAVLHAAGERATDHHRACASVLNARGGLDDTARASEHLWLAGDAEAAVETLTSALRAMQAQGKREQLERLFRLLDRCLELAPEAADRRPVLEATLVRHDAAWAAHRLEEATAGYRDLVVRARRAGDWTMVARVEASLARRTSFRDPAEGLRRAEAAEDALARLEDDDLYLRSVILFSRSSAYQLLGQYADGVAQAEAGGRAWVEHHEPANQPRFRALSQIRIAQAWRVSGAHETATRLSMEALEEFERIGHARGAQLALHALGRAATIRGDLNAALRWYDEAVARGADGIQGVGAIISRGDRIRVLLLGGRQEQAQTAAREVLADRTLPQDTTLFVGPLLALLVEAGLADDHDAWATHWSTLLRCVSDGVLIERAEVSLLEAVAAQLEHHPARAAEVLHLARVQPVRVGDAAALERIDRRLADLAV